MPFLGSTILETKQSTGQAYFYTYIFFKIYKLCFCVTYTIHSVDFIDIMGITLNTNLKRSQQNLKQNLICEFKKMIKMVCLVFNLNCLYLNTVALGCIHTKS